MGLLNGLKGFVLRRAALSVDAAEEKSVWVTDPRQLAATSAAAKKSATDDEGPDVPEDVASLKWQRILSKAIRSFHWGDFSLEPGRRYAYTLYTVYGDEKAVSAGDPSSRLPPDNGPGLHVGPCVSLQVETPPLDAGNHEVHFNRGAAGSQRYQHLFGDPTDHKSKRRSPEEWSWLSRGLEEALLRFIDVAEGPGWRICGALYEVHYLPVVQALARAHERGVEVSLVVDWKMAAWSEETRQWTQRGPQHLNNWALEEAGLISAGCLIKRTKPRSAISHNKFFVLVSPEKQAVAVWTGSTNISSGAIFGHSNVGHVIHERSLCERYLDYWEKLRMDPEKREMAAFNEEHSPLPEEGPRGLGEKASLVFFSPRRSWASALDFIAQLIRGARQSVAFTAAFGISGAIAPALLGGETVPKYVLLESEGNWAASRDAIQELRRRAHVRIAMGTHLRVAAEGSSWKPETLTGLNAHVQYIHTKILLIDPFSESPIVVSGSANFSQSSMESNDENMVVVKGDTGLADAYAVEFFRLFEHMRFRNDVEDLRKKDTCRAGAGATQCPCGQAVKQAVCQKGRNAGRPYFACAKPQGEGCGLFGWLDAQSTDEEVEETAMASWPQRCFDGSSFACLERRAMGSLGELPSPIEAACDQVEVSEEGEEDQDSQPTESPGLDEYDVLTAIGVLEEDGSKSDVVVKPLDQPQAAPSTPIPQELLANITLEVRALLELDLRKKGGRAQYKQGRADLQAAVLALPEHVALRAEALSALDDLDGSFVATAPKSWKPQLLRFLLLVGDNPDEVQQIARKHRLGQTLGAGFVT